MNMSSIISRLKRETGLAFISLPLEDFDKRTIEMLQDTTIRTFSQFFPDKTSEEIDLAQLQCLQNDYYHSIYRIPKIKNRDVVIIYSVIPNFKNSRGAMFDPIGDIYIGTYTEMMLSQASADLVSLATPAFTFNFEESSKLLHLYNGSTVGTNVLMEVGFKHANNLSTIPFTSEESFYELALLDFKNFIYQNLKHFDEIPTANGTIRLRMEDFQSAESDRKELLRDWDSKFHLDAKQYYFS